MAVLPFTAVADGSITLVKPNVAATGWLRVEHADHTVTRVNITSSPQVVPLKAGDLICQRLDVTYCFVPMVVSAVVP